MKSFFTILILLFFSKLYAQSAAQPIEEQHPVSMWWWVLGVLIAIGAGIGIYMLIKKDPKRDAVR